VTPKKEYRHQSHHNWAVQIAVPQVMTWAGDCRSYLMAERFPDNW
jgi:hypothetical protein